MLPDRLRGNGSFATSNMAVSGRRIATPAPLNILRDLVNAFHQLEELIEHQTTGELLQEVRRR